MTESSQTNINANSLYNNRTMILGNNVKNFVIIIPDEAHEQNPNTKLVGLFYKVLKITN